MIKKQKKTTFISILLGICIIFPLILSICNSKIKVNINNNDNVDLIPKQSVAHYLSNIFIDDNHEDYDWEEYANRPAHPWCTEVGGVYYIKNVVITEGGSIAIQHSDVNFVIENCMVSRIANNLIFSFFDDSFERFLVTF